MTPAYSARVRGLSRPARGLRRNGFPVPFLANETSTIPENRYGPGIIVQARMNFGHETAAHITANDLRLILIQPKLEIPGLGFQVSTAHRVVRAVEMMTYDVIKKAYGAIKYLSFDHAELPVCGYFPDFLSCIIL